MNETIHAVIPATFESSNRGQIHFGEVISRLSGIQVEAYHVGYRSGRTTYYQPDGATPDFAFQGPQAQLPMPSTAMPCARPSSEHNKVA